MEQQAKYETSRQYEVLAKTPNHISRHEKLNEYNKRQIETHGKRLKLREEQRPAKGREAQSEKKQKAAEKSAKKKKKKKK